MWCSLSNCSPSHEALNLVATRRTRSSIFANTRSNMTAGVAVVSWRMSSLRSVDGTRSSCTPLSSVGPTRLNLGILSPEVFSNDPEKEKFGASRPVVHGRRGDHFQRLMRTDAVSQGLRYVRKTFVHCRCIHCGFITETLGLLSHCISVLELSYSSIPITQQKCLWIRVALIDLRGSDSRQALLLVIPSASSLSTQPNRNGTRLLGAR
jgi:hypothetical protein